MDSKPHQVSGLSVSPFSGPSGISSNGDLDAQVPGAQGPAGAGPSMSQAQIGAIQNQSSPVGRDLSFDHNSSVLDHEWVGKAKDIVEKTKSDPFLESKELGRIRADYLKIRYNKHMEVNEDKTG